MKADSPRKYISWIHQTLAPVRLSFWGAVLMHLLAVVLSLSFVWVSKALVDVATGVFAGGEPVSFSPLILLGAAMILLVIVRDSVRILLGVVQTRSSARVEMSLRQKEFDSLIRMDGDVRRKFHSADIISRVETDVTAVSSAFCAGLPELCGAFLQFAAAFVYLLVLQPSLAWILLAVLPCGVFAGSYLFRKVRVLTRDVREGDSKVQMHIQESVRHQSIIKTMEYDRFSIGQLDALQDELYSRTMKRMRFGAVSRLVFSLTMSVSYSLAFLWGVNGLSKGLVTFGMMTAFLQLVGQLQRPLSRISSLLPALLRSTASIDRLTELDSTSKESLHQPQMTSGVAGIRVSHVSFRYPDSELDVFSDFSCEFPPLSRTAVVGETGVGKSTLLKLLLSLEKPLSGNIELYSGEQTLEVSPSTRCNLVYVPQGNTLFSGTIRQNLLVGCPDADDDRLWKALETAAADFVRDLPGGLDTQCFEAGGGLSEGQAQRIAIARALLRPGSILLLDEMSSALDASTERILMERLCGEMPDKTMIFITHRDTVGRFCDRTLVL